MARRTFLYYLFGPGNKPYYVDDNGFVMQGDANFNKPDGQPAHLEVSPDGWKDTLVKYARNIKYWGVFRDMTVPMKFPKDGAKILKHAFWNTLGIEAVVKMGMKKLNKTLLPYTYKPWYLSELNMAKMQQTLTHVKVEALEGGPSKYFKAHENEVYEIPIDTDPEHFNILFDGMSLNGNQSWRFSGEDLISLHGLPPFNDRGFYKHAMPMRRNASEGTGVNIVYNDEDLNIYVATSSFDSQMRASDNCFVQADSTAPSPVSVNLSIKLKFIVTSKMGNTNFRFRLDIVNPATAINTGFFIYDAPDAGINNVTESNYSGTIVLQPGDKIFLNLYRTFDGINGPDTIFHFLEDSYAKVNFTSKVAPTTVKGLYPFRVFEKLFEKASGGLFQVKSNWLSLKKDIAIISGDALRGLLTEYELDGITIKKQGAVIKTSIADFFKSMNHWGSAMGIEKDKLVIELFSSFFNTTVILNIAEIVEWAVDPAEDLFFNTIRAGGPTKDYEDVNGKLETNQQQVWGTPITKVVKELDLTTPYRRDPFGAEFLRKEFIGRDTTDSSGDNDTWMINIETSLQPADLFYPAPYYKLYRPNYILIEGLPVDAYNTELTPVHTILNNGSFIRSILDKWDSAFLTLNTKDKNVDFRTILNGIEVSQKKPISIGALSDRLFLPYYISGTTQGNINLLETIDANPYGLVEKIVNGKTFKSFLMDGGVRPGDHDKQNWKMLSSADNNQFVNI